MDAVVTVTVLAPPGVPRERVALLRKAFLALMQDQEFLEDVKKAKIEIDMVAGEEVERVVHLIVSTPPELAERYAKALGPETK